MTSGAILAGGQARRFGGHDKSQLRVGGRTILERQLDALQGVVDRIYLVGSRGPIVAPPHASVIPDRTPGQGPLGGLDAALSVSGGHVLALACDMPYVTSALLGYLIHQLADVDAVVPRTERGYHPLCAVYAQTCRTAVQRHLEAGSLRLQDLLADLTIRVVEESDLVRFGEPERLLANVNSQADLDALESLQNH
jgi:molybdopterin-guanine dinucleotide biosynthesis protein A